MASNLASIHGTEKDRVNCPFFLKVGACRHDDRCSRLHTRPTESQTLILANMYMFPNATLPIQQRNSHFEDFYEDVFEELSKHGDIEELHVCDNLSDHMIGDVYVKFSKEEQAAAAKSALSGRYYAERHMVLDFSPVTDFREASCRQYDERSCQKGGYCNFLHLKRISRDFRRTLYGRRGRRYGGGRLEKYCRRSDRKRRHGRRSRSRSPPSKKGRARRDGSVERRAKIELWNREREEFQVAAAAASEHDNGADFRNVHINHSSIDIIGIAKKNLWTSTQLCQDVLGEVQAMAMAMF